MIKFMDEIVNLAMVTILVYSTAHPCLVQITVEINHSVRFLSSQTRKPLKSSIGHAHEKAGISWRWTTRVSVLDSKMPAICGKEILIGWGNRGIQESQLFNWRCPCWNPRIPVCSLAFYI